MKKPTFSDWLRESLLFVAYGPMIWLSYSVCVGVLMTMGKTSLLLGIVFSVTSLFVGVGVAKYIDLKYSVETTVTLPWAIKKSLPLAILAAVTIVVFWFIFMVLAYVLMDELYKVGQFFFYWELTPQNIEYRSGREIAMWVYAYADVTLMFTVLMVTTFASWFSYPLMLFKDYSWSQAREQGNYIVSRNQKAVYKMVGFIILEALLCTTVTPLLTPVLYMLTSTMMYVSYRALFEP